MHVAKLFDLTGRIAVVTGGSRGLGRQMAIAFAEAGAKVAIIARREQWLTPTYEEIRSSGAECLALRADVANQESVKRFVNEVIDKWDRIDILVNNAGVVWSAPSHEMPLEKWNLVMNTNITGMFICCQEIGRKLIAQHEGVIINIASVIGLIAPDPEVHKVVGYAASKGGVVALTKHLAAEWAPYNIRVNAIAPFWFPTRMSEATIERLGDKMLRRIPMGRVGREEEIRGVALFLASEASSYITGQTICVDGGATVW